MRIFKHKRFSQWAKREGILDATLKLAAIEMNNGLFDAELGGGLFKKRIARQGKGKRSGYRTLLAFKQNDRAIFVFGFAKKELDNIDAKEKQIYKSLAKTYLQVNAQEIKALINLDELIEVK